MTGEFFTYHAGALAIDPARPWQVLSEMGSVCGKFASEQAARTAVEALNADKKLGKLPYNLSQWDKAYLLKETENSAAGG